MKIALIDRNPETRAHWAELAARAGLHGTGFPGGRALMRSLQREPYDLFLLDWDLPDLGGADLVEGIRSQAGDGPPVLLLTAPLAESQAAQALRAGADCVLAKPCPPELLLEQMRALIRRALCASAGTVETYGRFAFEPARRRLTVGGTEVAMTPKEFALALLLFRNLDRPVARTRILEMIWGIDPRLSTRTLDIHVSKIRTKLGLQPEQGYRISPVYGFGYRLDDLSA